MLVHMQKVSGHHRKPLISFKSLPVLAVTTLQQMLGWLPNDVDGNLRTVIAKLMAEPC